MAANKNSFVLYKDLIHTVRKMPKEKQADLFMHILSYVNDENPTTEDLIIELTFEPIKQQLKRDLVKYENVKERNRINGRSGGRPKKEPKKPTGLIENPKEPKKADSDSVSDIILLKKESKDARVDWEAFKSQFNDITGKKIKVIDNKAKNQIKARLNEGYTKDDLVVAIINCRDDPYHKESNLKYLTPEFITRADKLSKYLAINPKT